MRYVFLTAGLLLCPAFVVAQQPQAPTTLSLADAIALATGNAGLLDAHDFFSHLARRIFPCTDYIRGRHELDYTPAPDCFHDIFGHTPMIMHPRFADFYQHIGEAALA